MPGSGTDIRLCALFGSPDRDGFSSRLHEWFLSSCADLRIERFHVYSMDIAPCDGCLCCSDGGKCRIRDDMDRVYDAIARSEYLSFSYPLYFSSMPGPLKNLIDRCNLLWVRNRLGRYPVSGQRGIAFASAGSEYRDMFTPSLTVISHLMNSLGGRLDRGNSVCLGGLDTEKGRAAYEQLLSDSETLSSAVVSFLSGTSKKV